MTNDPKKQNQINTKTVKEKHLRPNKYKMKSILNFIMEIIIFLFDSRVKSKSPASIISHVIAHLDNFSKNLKYLFYNIQFVVYPHVNHYNFSLIFQFPYNLMLGKCSLEKR